MPRSKRRKGAKVQQSKQKRRGFIDAGTAKRYYDPGTHPRPRNMVKGLQASTPRHDHRRGGA